MFNRLFKPKSNLDVLKKHPGMMLVDDTHIAAELPDGRIVVITGDFKNITEEDANLKLQAALQKVIDGNTL